MSRAAVGALLLVLGVAIFLWIVYGTTFDSAGTSLASFLAWLVVRAAAFAAVTGGAWLIATRRAGDLH